MPYVYVVQHEYDRNKKKVRVTKSKLFVVRDVPMEALVMFLEEKLKEKYGFLLQEKKK